MARYRLLEGKIPTDIVANSKKEINSWCEKMRIKGIEWQSGYMLKLYDYDPVYDWIHDKDHSKHVRI